MKAAKLKKLCDLAHASLDYHAIRDLMKATNHTWGRKGRDRVPDVSELQDTARDRLNSLQEGNCFASSGGFTAWKRRGYVGLYYSQHDTIVDKDDL